MSAIQYMSQGGDPIDKLPMDQSQPTHKELQIVDTLFTKHKGTVSVIVQEAKDSVIVGLLFIVFSLPPIENLIRRFLPITDKSIYIRIGIKALIVASLFWLIKHFYLSRKKT